ncbi:bax inhibitor 1 [Plasmopara halstedii]|uniref:Bax inhibitor 1 n=1 Tax=Plasmopara halstedii TaxID=4781 RepID=A0A0P1AX19_PLAHL|nr:bax inhibitor 1 [Plasmopara halstedii]CEG45268.1 bax inhibitor 1 [Plasmopara halstedii]|eukprot:XP_024581637.1 bax inhibitor 1 [Plasmopara halstedii]
MKTSGITEDVQQHLMRVYATLAACVMSAMISSAVTLAFGPERITLMSSSIMTTIGSIWLYVEPQQNFYKRFCILIAISASVGLTVSTLVAVAIELNPSILVSALMLTTLVFLCFTGSALLATRRAYLYLGGTLSSALSVLLLTNLFSIFKYSSFLFHVNLYGGLFVFCGYVVYDTQLIIEKASFGDKDVLAHTLSLFMDLGHAKLRDLRF